MHTRLGKFYGRIQGFWLGECAWKTLVVLLTHDIIHRDSYISTKIPIVFTIFIEPLAQVTSMLRIGSYWFSMKIPIVPKRFLQFKKDSHNSNHISRTTSPCYFHVMNRKLLVFHIDSYNSNSSLFHKLMPKEWPCSISRQR